MKRWIFGALAAMSSLVFVAESADAQQSRQRYYGPMPGSTPQVYGPGHYNPPPRIFFPQKTPQGILGGYGARQYIGGKVIQYAPRAGRFIKGSPAGAIGSTLFWPEIAY